MEEINDQLSFIWKYLCYRFWLESPFIIKEKIIEIKRINNKDNQLEKKKEQIFFSIGPLYSLHLRLWQIYPIILRRFSSAYFTKFWVWGNNILAFFTLIFKIATFGTKVVAPFTYEWAIQQIKPNVRAAHVSHYSDRLRENISVIDKGVRCSSWATASCISSVKSVSGGSSSVHHVKTFPFLRPEAYWRSLLLQAISVGDSWRKDVSQNWLGPKGFL